MFILRCFLAPGSAQQNHYGLIVSISILHSILSNLNSFQIWQNFPQWKEDRPTKICPKSSSHSLFFSRKFCKIVCKWFNFYSGIVYAHKQGQFHKSFDIITVLLQFLNKKCKLYISFVGFGAEKMITELPKTRLIKSLLFNFSTVQEHTTVSYS